MIEFVHEIKDPQGLHARPASKLFMEASAFRCSVEAVYEGQTADVKNILAIMGLGAAGGGKITFRLNGSDENEAAEALKKVLSFK